jgi:hypothetical protein
VHFDAPWMNWLDSWPLSCNLAATKIAGIHTAVDKYDFIPAPLIDCIQEGAFRSGHSPKHRPKTTCSELGAHSSCRVCHTPRLLPC